VTWETRRTKPYTKAGIKRLACIRCGGQAHAGWSICADGNVHRPICQACDIELNRMVLAWMGHPDVAGAMARYEGAT
jgi:hypothetical protein